MTEDRAAIAQRAAAMLGARIETPRWTPLPHQIPPSGNWAGWALVAGRGAGKTDACAAYIDQHVNGPPCLTGAVPHWIGIIAPTLGDAATSCFAGPSGIRAHSPGSKLTNGPGGLTVKWPNGSEAKLFGAHTPEDVERLRSGGNRCVAEGTLVRTEHGLRPIESVRAGDRVWTRNGLRSVLRTWDNGIKDVEEYGHASGSTWLTPDHEIWTTRGWKEARFVSPNDTVLTWENTATHSTPTASHGSGEKTATTRTSTVASFTGTSTPGRSAPYRTGCTSITRTTTSRTIGLRTLHCCAQVSTLLSTPTSEELTGTARAAMQHGPRSSPGRSPACDVAASSNPEALRSAQSIVPLPVATMGHDRGSGGCALCAALSSNVSPEGTAAPVRAGALRSTPTRSAARVYDLTVEHDHEFFAGDLLVSNCAVWAEELAAWRYLDAAWDHMRFGLRVGPRPHWIASTTPKPKPLIKKMVKGEIANVVLSTASTFDNPHLEQHIRDALEETYGGTQLGQQELLGLVMDQDENALWTRSMIDAARVRPDDRPDLVRIAVGVDPSGGAGEQGVVVVGKSGLILPGDGGRPQHHGYVLDDRTCKLPPDGWGRRAVQAAIDWEADELTVETNYGGAMAVAVLRTAADALGVNIPIRTVTATRGKAVRAQPVAALTAQGRWHHAGMFPALEEQLVTWYPEIGWSPDRLDAMVWPAWQLKLVRAVSSGQGSLGGDLARRQIVGGRGRQGVR